MITKKPWGHERVLYRDGNKKLKSLFVLPAHSLSLQYHKEKDEAMVLVKGKATIIIGSSSEEMKPGKIYHVMPKATHRVTGISEATILELSSGDDADIFRLEDLYGRSQ